ncbi:uncharacterized protein LOC119001795 [Sturnira hondurensis]|uniref:uncharacterized protein LOC119001795 n=1 Tax=Sturnira hondurensis TaxID=192404 RepID=UPI0018797522|nr:uncharacterized protein LOC119001795 [Sturnira hondurensis]
MLLSARAGGQQPISHGWHSLACAVLLVAMTMPQLYYCGLYTHRLLHPCLPRPGETRLGPGGHFRACGSQWSQSSAPTPHPSPTSEQRAVDCREHCGVVPRGPGARGPLVALSQCLFVVLAMAFGPSLAPLWSQPLLPTDLPTGAGRVSFVGRPPSMSPETGRVSFQRPKNQERFTGIREAQSPSLFVCLSPWWGMGLSWRPLWPMPAVHRRAGVLCWCRTQQAGPLPWVAALRPGVERQGWESSHGLYGRLEKGWTGWSIFPLPPERPQLTDLLYSCAPWGGAQALPQQVPLTSLDWPLHRPFLAPGCPRLGHLGSVASSRGGHMCTHAHRSTHIDISMHLHVGTDPSASPVCTHTEHFSPACSAGSSGHLLGSLQHLHSHLIQDRWP